MSDSSTLSDNEQDGTRCPIPAWALRPFAILLPLAAVAAILWLVFH